MSIKLRFDAGAMVVQAVLKDEALSDLLKLIQEKRSDEAPEPSPHAITAQIINTTSSPIPSLASIDDPERFSKAWLAKHGPSEVLNKFGWDTFPEKILALGAWIEAAHKDEDFDSWRSADILQVFSDAKDGAPTNFPRDIANAIKSGFVNAKTPRTYLVSRTGWDKLAKAISKAEAAFSG